jgi:hypothetical protein
MKQSKLSTIAQNRTGFFFLVSFGGMFCGIFLFLLFSRLSATYAVFCTLSIIVPLSMIIFKNSKYVLWSLMIVCLPISIDFTINHSGHLGGAAGYMISFYDIVLFLLYFLWICEMVKKRKFIVKVFPVISLPAVCLISIASLSIVRSRYPELSIYETIEVLKMYLTFIYLANNIKTQKDIEFISTIFIACLIFEGVLAWAQHHYSRPFFPGTLGGPGWINTRVKGTWIDPNDFAWYLTIFLPISFTMLFASIKQIYKGISFLAFAFGSAALVWTNSRAGWISFGMALAFLSVLVFSKITKKRVLIEIFLTSIVILIFIFPLYPRLHNKIYGRFIAHDKGSAKSRIPQFEIAFNIIQEYPFLGIGINNYSEIMWEYDTTEEGLAQITSFPVHNIFLHITAEMGIFALFIFLWFIIAIYLTGLIYIFNNDNFMILVVIGLLAGILAFLLHGMVDTASIGSKMFLFIWFYAGMIMGIGEVKPYCSINKKAN